MFQYISLFLSIPLLLAAHEDRSNKVALQDNAQSRTSGFDMFDSDLFKRGVGSDCGPSFGSCSTSGCCSSMGWCGTSRDHCAAPDCQIDFGPGCDGNRSPGSPSTAEIKREKNSALMYGGSGIFKCKASTLRVNVSQSGLTVYYQIPGTIALTYDDGPSSPHTEMILDLLEKYNAKGAFFINGNGKGRGMIEDPSTRWPAILKRTYNAGHQIGSHTWSHQDMSKINTTQLKNQVVWNEMALNNVLGVIPTYMRPPYSSCSGDCQALMADMGYHITYFDLDTEDTIWTGSTTIPEADFTGNITSSDRRLVISHNIEPVTASALTEHMLKGIQAAGLKAVTVGECLDEPPENWYRLASGAPYVPPSSWTRYIKPAQATPSDSQSPNAPSSAENNSGSEPSKPSMLLSTATSNTSLAPDMSEQAAAGSSTPSPSSSTPSSPPSSSTPSSSGAISTPINGVKDSSNATTTSSTQSVPSTKPTKNVAGAVELFWFTALAAPIVLACHYFT